MAQGDKTTEGVSVQALLVSNAFEIPAQIAGLERKGILIHREEHKHAAR